MGAPAPVPPTGPPRFSGGGVALGTGGGAGGAAGSAAGAAAARLAGGGRAPVAKAAPSEAEVLMKMYVDAQLAQIDELIESINGAPPDLVVPALELLTKIFSAIVDNPNEPKVALVRLSAPSPALRTTPARPMGLSPATTGPLAAPDRAAMASAGPKDSV